MAFEKQQDITVIREFDASTAVVKMPAGARGKQEDPIAKTDVANTINLSDMVNGLMEVTQATGGNVNLTTVTGTAIDSALPSDFAVNETIDFSIINLSAALVDVVTVVGGTGVTVVGQAVIDSAHIDSEFPSSGRFRLRKTAVATYSLYRL